MMKFHASTKYKIWGIKKKIMLIVIIIGSLSSEPHSQESTQLQLSAFDQAVIDFYFNNPDLVEHSSQTASSPLAYYWSSALKNKKLILQRIIDAIALSYCCYGIRNNYIHNYYSQNPELNSKIEILFKTICPSIVRTMPAHVGFFMQTLELILKLFFLKTATKIAVYLLI